MIHALTAAVVLAAGFDAAACSKNVRVARVHLVDGMPFVDALRPTIRVRRTAGPKPENVFAVYDGPAMVGYLTFAPDGSVAVSGVVRADPAARFVDLYELPHTCPRPSATMTVSLHPMP
jgi:hypothetical protein